MTCAVVLEEGPGPTSHGLCEKCLDIWMHRLDLQEERLSKELIQEYMTVPRRK